MKFISVFLFLFIAFIPEFTLSDTDRQGFPDTLYPVEDILALSAELELNDSQKEKIDALAMQHENESTYLSTKLKALSDRFAEVIAEASVNRAEASIVLDEISAVEKVQKERTLLFLIDLKNLLTEQQKEILNRRRGN